MIDATHAQDKLTGNLSETESILKQVFEKCSDAVFRTVHASDDVTILLIYIDGLVDTARLEETVLGQLGSRTGALSAANVKETDELGACVSGILTGQALLVRDKEPQAVLIDMAKFPMRSVEEPVNEPSVRGPREGFTEVLRTNTSMLRRKLPTPLLKLEALTLGEVSHTSIVLVYLEGTTSPDLLQEIRKRLDSIDVKSIQDSSYIEEWIEDNRFSPFPQIQNTERPDTVSSSLLEGKAAILVNGSPNALVLPMTFWSGFQTAEDHYEKFMYVSAVRIIRFILFFMSLLLPSFYVALTTFHPQMIPVTLMMSISAAREGIPFPTLVETIMMEIMIEGLREAGIRLPKAIGPAVSIVGAIVIGQAAVEAGFISAPIVIIVASTGIASFAIPRYSMSLPIRLLRFPLIILSGIFGFFGIATGTIAILTHLCSLKSYGVPYFTPIAPLRLRGWKDTLLRLPRERRQA